MQDLGRVVRRGPSGSFPGPRQPAPRRGPGSLGPGPRCCQTRPAPFDDAELAQESRSPASELVLDTTSLTATDSARMVLDPTRT